VKLRVFSATQSIIGLTVVVLFEKSLQPLAEFKIVKVPSLYELGDINVSFYAVLVKCSLKKFVVFDKLVLVFSSPFYS